MYQVDSTWLRDKLEAKETKLNDKITRYSDAIDVSQQMVNNCYDAFYTVSECSKKGGCDFMSTVDSLTELNVERKILRQKLDRLLDHIDTPIPPNFSPSQTQ
jgi:uncharacterized protein YhaN